MARLKTANIFLKCTCAVLSFCIFVLRVVFPPSFQAKQGSCSSGLCLEVWAWVVALGDIEASQLGIIAWKYPCFWSAFPKTCSAKQPWPHCGCEVLHQSRPGHRTHAAKEQWSLLWSRIIMKRLQDVLRSMAHGGERVEECASAALAYVTRVVYIVR